MNSAFFICAIITLILLPGCTLTVEGNMAECEMEAMKEFAQLRQPHKISGILMPTSVEMEYREQCMKARGFVFDTRKNIRDALDQNRSVSDYTATWNAKYWKVDWRRYTFGLV